MLTRPINSLPKIDLSGGVCQCGHSHQWHDRGEPGPTFNYTGPCLVGLCACKGYDYSGLWVGALLGKSVGRDSR